MERKTRRFISTTDSNGNRIYMWKIGSVHGADSRWLSTENEDIVPPIEARIFDDTFDSTFN